MKLADTPIEKYNHPDTNTPYSVKREDLSVPFPGPPFSKMRGLVPHLQRLKEEGVRYVGYTESAISMAGWGVAWACKEMGLNAVLFDPQYKEGNTPDLLKYHRKRWEENGAIIIPQDAGMVRVNHNIARQILREKFSPKYSRLLPLGLTLPETVEETTKVAKDVRGLYKSVVVNVGSGTIAAGLSKGLGDRSTVYGIMGRAGDVKRKRELIAHKGRFTIKTPGGLFGNDFRLVDPGWEYSGRSVAPCPFPCHPYYDRKAFQWMMENILFLKSPILFWNIGSMPELQGEEK